MRSSVSYRRYEPGKLEERLRRAVTQPGSLATVNGIQDWFLEYGIACKMRVRETGSTPSLSFRVEWRWRNFVREQMPLILMAGIECRVRGTLLPWECQWPLIVQTKL